MHSDPQSLKSEEETVVDDEYYRSPGPGTAITGFLNISISGAAFRPAHITRAGGVDFFINHEYGYVSGHNEGGGYVVAPVQGLPESGQVTIFSAWLYSDGPEIAAFLMKSAQVDGERPRRSTIVSILKHSDTQDKIVRVDQVFTSTDPDRRFLPGNALYVAARVRTTGQRIYAVGVRCAYNPHRHP